jgi:hypothetical protein
MAKQGTGTYSRLKGISSEERGTLSQAAGFEAQAKEAHVCESAEMT